VQNLQAGNMVIGILALLIALLAVALIVEAILAVSKQRKGEASPAEDDSAEAAG
jgi:hypothetical protein